MVFCGARAEIYIINYIKIHLAKSNDKEMWTRIYCNYEKWILKVNIQKIENSNLNL